MLRSHQYSLILWFVIIGIFVHSTSFANDLRKAKVCNGNKIVGVYFKKNSTDIIEKHKLKPFGENKLLKWRLFFEDLIQVQKDVCLIQDSNLVLDQLGSTIPKHLSLKAEQQYFAAEKYFLRGEDVKVIELLKTALKGLAEQPGNWGALKRAHILAATFYEAHLQKTKAALYIKKSILLDPHGNNLSDLRFSPWFTNQYKFIYKKLKNTLKLVPTTVVVKGGHKETPVFVNGELKGYGKKLTFDFWEGHELLVTAGGSKDSKVYKVKSGETVVVKAKTNKHWHKFKNKLISYGEGEASEIIKFGGFYYPEYALIFSVSPEFKGKKIHVYFYNVYKDKVLYDVYFENKFNRANLQIIKHHISLVFDKIF